MTQIAIANWTPFWLETNAAFGPVRSPEDWEHMRAKWQKHFPLDNPDDIYDLKLAKDTVMMGDLPSYGSRIEHIGDGETLREFFIKNGMLSDEKDPLSKLAAIRTAIKQYYAALNQREHGDIAQNKAFRAIENILGMRWEQGKTL